MHGADGDRESSGLLWLADGIGETVLIANGGVLSPLPLRETLSTDTKYLLLYFSARWCPLCLDFDRLAREVYDEVGALLEDSGGGEVEICLVSCDVSEAAFCAHIGALGDGFTALPWSRSMQEEVAAHYGVTHIPALLVLDPGEGLVVTASGRDDVIEARKALVERRIVMDNSLGGPGFDIAIDGRDLALALLAKWGNT